MPKYSYPDPSKLLWYLSHEENLDLSRDWSEYLLIKLALAIHAATQLQGMGYDLSIQGRPILINTLERAWREALQVRTQKIPSGSPTSEKFRINRFGNIE